METPSIFSSHTNEVASATRRVRRAPHAASSSSEKAFSSDIIGTVWVTGANRAETGPPTRCVGESATARSGCSASSERRRRTRASYSASETSGSSSWW
jgi:hypothetical protein